MTLATIGRASASAPRWAVPALIASLALNLIVIGTAAGFLWRHLPAFQAANADHLPPSLLNYASTLPPARYKEIVVATDQRRESVRPLRRQLREAREAAVNALVAEPFDKARFQAAQEQVLAADQKAREAVFQLYTDIAANMTPEERRAFAEWRQARRKMRIRARNPLDDEPEKQTGTR